MDYQDINFKQAISILLEIEGGYSNDKNDLGGETNFGISKRQYPHLDIKNLTKQQAADIYYKDFWIEFNLNQIKDSAIATQLLLMFVNLSPTSASKCLQNALVVLGSTIKVDGIFGPICVSEVNRLSSTFLSCSIRLELVKFYINRATVNLSQRPKLLGWIRRALL